MHGHSSRAEIEAAFTIHDRRGAARSHHEGQRPMAIRWRLEREIPAAWLPVMALAA